jgi:tetratricopeptide (TPR) repeat protein
MRGREAMKAGRFAPALEAFRTAMTYPRNLEAAEPRGGPGSAKIHYHIGLAQEGLGRKAAAKASFELALAFGTGVSEDAYYRGSALTKLGRGSEASAVFDGLARTGPSPYLKGLGLLGQGKATEASAAFAKARELDPYDPEIGYFLRTLAPVR